jgi:hypothetical protein
MYIIVVFDVCYNMFSMPHKISSIKKKKVNSKADLWLPIDSRLIPDIISFGHVKGLARVFMVIEIMLSCLIVIGTLGLVIIKCIS